MIDEKKRLSQPGPRSKKAAKAFSLIEMLIALILLPSVAMAIYWMTMHTAHQVSLYMERFNMHTQISNTLQDISLRCTSAVEIDNETSFSGYEPEELHNFKFRGQGNIFNITPEENSDDIWYEYYIKCPSGQRCPDGLRGALMIRNVDTGTERVLIEGKYQADVVFRFTPAVDGSSEEPMSPNFFKVHVTTHSKRKNLFGVSSTVEKIQGVRFWFIDVVKRR
ncbi:MAG TPA: prepilin-type N-terminal cleavage/methylation domain-containing protein [Candidatus Omnitrophota bacterium]|nr:prepilin-type N-terminal cleavage/methylation domain-containing protein [Candidatus Omnitrophota bacterium]HRZ15078.1 prepilin-type N-terminal cleavage/methylation domain-containing protein [Candidatus Omnitrophota bacterium]